MPQSLSLSAQTLTRLKWLSLAVLVLFLGVVSFYAVNSLPELETQVVGGELSDEQKLYLEYRLNDQLEGNFVTLDLADAQALLEQEDWISSVLIEKKWPNLLSVRVIPKVPVARFGSNRFVDAEGGLYQQASFNQSDQNLVSFYGPSDQTAGMMSRYEIVNRWFSVLGYRLQDVQLSPGGLWLFQFEPALTVLIGQDQSPAKLYELSELMSGPLKPALSQIRVVDLRYVSGLSIRWKGSKAAGQKLLEADPASDTNLLASLP